MNDPKTKALADAQRAKEANQRERDAKIAEAIEGPRFHKFSDYDNSPQGQKAISLGIKNKQGAPYDYLKSPAANFNWPDLDPNSIGNLEPWLCYAKTGGWKDLNAIAIGAERRATAAYRTLGDVESELFKRVDDATFATIAKLEAMSDAELLGMAQQAGLRKDARYSYRDYLFGIKLECEDALRRANKKAQKALDAALDHDKKVMDGHIAAAKSGGLLDPVQGVSLEDWAGANAKIAAGESLEVVLKVLQLEKPAWDAISAEWMGRMSRDTTFAISTVYGGAFTNPNIGRFAVKGGAAAAPKPAGGGALDKVLGDFELYVKIMTHQSVGAGQGQDAAAILKKYGLTVADWAKVGMHWGTKMTSDMALATKMGGLMQKFTAELSAPGAGDDISF
jgi:hypothetical protein